MLVCRQEHTAGAAFPPLKLRVTHMAMDFPHAIINLCIQLMVCKCGDLFYFNSISPTLCDCVTSATQQPLCCSEYDSLSLLRERSSSLTPPAASGGARNWGSFKPKKHVIILKAPASHRGDRLKRKGVCAFH